MAVHGHSETTANVLFAVAKIKGYLGKTQWWCDVATLSHVLFEVFRDNDAKCKTDTVMLITCGIDSSALIQSFLLFFAWCFALSATLLSFEWPKESKQRKGQPSRFLLQANH